MVNVVSRAAWGARAPKSRNKISVPVSENWLHHTAGSEAGADGMRRIQNYHMDSKGWSDIGYSWVYDKDERTWYEGRGWGISGAHTYGHNSVSHGYCVMGNFNNEGVEPHMIDDIAWMIVQGYKNGKGPAELTGGHRDTGSTSCPGDNLYRAIPLVNKKITELLEGGSSMTNGAGLIRINGGNAVYQVVGEYLIPLTDPAQANIAVRTHGGDGSSWHSWVVDLTTEQAAKFTRLPAGSLTGTGKHTHDEYAPKAHAHNLPEHTHPASDHSHELTFTVD